jgi:hypothetical protein
VWDCNSSAITTKEMVIMNMNEPQDNLGFPYVRQMTTMLEAGPVTTISLATGKDVQFFGLQGAEADFFYFLSRRPDMGENTQSLLDNTELVGDSLVSDNTTFEEIAAIMYEDEDEEVDFVIGLKTES